MSKQQINRGSLAVLFFTLFLFNSCVKKKYDNISSNTTYDPHLAVNYSIHTLDSIALNMRVGGALTFDSNLIISGIVTADDRSGNFYKQIVIQDSTGGIILALSESSLFTAYPIGRKVYVKLKGLSLVNVNGTPEIADTVDYRGAAVGIAAAVIPNYVVQASYPNTVTPVLVTLPRLIAGTSTYINRLVTLQNMEFAPASVNVPYASTSATSTSRTLVSCDGGTIVLYNSSYANFASALEPGGNGTVTGIYTVYNGSGQFQIRDTSDVILNGSRCETHLTIAQLRDSAKTNPPHQVLGGYVITGVVVASSLDSGSLSKGNVYIEDNSGRGIEVYYGSGNTLYIGDSVYIDVTGDSLTEYKNQPPFEITATSSSVLPGQTIIYAGAGHLQPAQVTINQINGGGAYQECTLVTIKHVKFPAGTFSGNATISDNSFGPQNTITMYTPPTATFAGETMPESSSATYTVTGVLSSYGTYQFSIRTPADIVKE
jgi:DNA/RNA endonuclease YhcR with UshA esterase domain